MPSNMESLNLNTNTLFLIKKLLINDNLLFSLLDVNVSDEALAFLSGREEFLKSGFLELDFDGKLLQSREFARFIYPFKNADSVIKYESEEKFICYFKTPLGMFCIEHTGDTRFVAKAVKASAPSEWLKTFLFNASKGRVSSDNKVSKKLSELSETEAKSNNRAISLAEHMCIFFERERKNA